MCYKSKPEKMGLVQSEFTGIVMGELSEYLLISKAPEMFEMLQKCLQCFEALNTDSIICDDIKQLLKQATEL